jgi:hypothetical protein
MRKLKPNFNFQKLFYVVMISLLLLIIINVFSLIFIENEKFFRVSCFILLILLFTTIIAGSYYSSKIITRATKQLVGKDARILYLLIWIPIIILFVTWFPLVKQKVSEIFVFLLDVFLFALIIILAYFLKIKNKK